MKSYLSFFILSIIFLCLINVSCQNPNGKDINTDNSWFQIKNSLGRCLSDVRNGEPLKFEECSTKNDGHFFKFVKNKDPKSFRIISSKGNSIKFSNDSIVSTFFKSDKFQKFLIQEKNGKLKIKNKDKTCLNSVAKLSPCIKGVNEQKFTLEAFDKKFILQ
jgi:hypothetical protein